MIGSTWNGWGMGICYNIFKTGCQTKQRVLRNGQFSDCLDVSSGIVGLSLLELQRHFFQSIFDRSAPEHF